MNKVIFQSTLASLLLGLGGIMMPLNTVEAAAAAADACSKELLLAYFPQNFVTATLKKFNVPQDKWDVIAKDLAAKDKDVVKEVEEKAAKLTPNPLKDRSPEQRQAAVKIFRESLFDIFSSVLKAHGVTDEKQIQAMLADIQQQKATNFAQCMEKQKTQFEKERSGQPQTTPDAQQTTKSVPSDEVKTKDNYLAEDSNDDSSKDNADEDADEADDSDAEDQKTESSKLKPKPIPTPSQPKQDSLSAWSGWGDSSHADTHSEDEDQDQDHDHDHDDDVRF